MSNNQKESISHRDYLSLEEATKFCNYSQEYLSLRARQGKLKALKFSNNWVTKAEWLEDYQKGVEDYNNQINNKKLKKQTIKVSSPAPPANLPVKRLLEMDLSLKEVSSALKVLLVVVLITAGVFLGKESLWKSYRGLLAEVSDNVFTAAVNHQDTLKSLSDVFGEYGHWLKSQALELLY